MLIPPKLIHISSIIISICISLFFSYSALQCLNSYSTFEMETGRLRIAKDQINKAREQRQRVAQYNKAMATFAKFTSQVNHFGLTPEHWQSYDVNVDRALTFAETGNILDQLSHDKTYYFIPAHLYIGTGAYRQDPNNTETTENKSTQITPPVTIPGNTADTPSDLTFTVQGKFKVRDGL